VKVFNIETQATVLDLGSPGDIMRTAAFDVDNTRIAGGGDLKEATVWEKDTGLVICCFRRHRAPVRCVAFSPDGRLCVSASNDGTARVWKADTAEELSVFEAPGRMVCVAYANDGLRVCAGGGDGFVRVFDSNTGGVVVDLVGHVQAIKCVAWTLDDRKIITSSEDCSVRMWDSASGAEVSGKLPIRSCVY